MKTKALSVILILILVFTYIPTLSVHAIGNTFSTSTISSGTANSFAIASDGSLWAWGSNHVGQLGDGTTTDRSAPVKIMEGVTDIDIGARHGLAIKNDGSLWSWGDNEFGQLGDGTIITNRSTPVKIKDNVVAVSAGSFHSLAIRDDGSLWAWGMNIWGELGDGTRDRRLMPVRILCDVIAVSAGGSFSFAIRSDGSLWAWGSNQHGQLGNGISGFGEYALTPMKVMDGVTAVSAGFIHSLAIKNDRSLWAWGNNESGQLGDGSMTNSSTPVKIKDNIIAISAGSLHSLAIKNDDSLWEWGHHISEFLGINDSIDRSIPVKIMDDVAAVSGGHENSLALKNDRSLWGWGANWNGALGTNVPPNGISRPIELMDGIMLPSSAPIPLFHNLPSAWAAEEVSMAIAERLVPESIVCAGWQNPTSRLDAAYAIIMLIEKTSGNTMSQIASEHGWDLSINQFYDTNSHAVTFLKYAGITTGVGNNRYDPDGTYTRAMIVTMIGRAAETFFGITVQGASSFTDVPNWAAPYVGYAADNGITQGVGGGRFDPNGILQNEHIAVFSHRTFRIWSKI